MSGNEDTRLRKAYGGQATFNTQLPTSNKGFQSRRLSTIPTQSKIRIPTFF